MTEITRPAVELAPPQPRGRFGRLRVGRKYSATAPTAGKRSTRRKVVIALVSVVVVIAVGAGVAILVTRNDSPPTLVDSFERHDRLSGLGHSQGGPRWTEVLGTWGISDSKALVTRPDVQTNVVVGNMPSSVGTVQVKLGSVVDGAGLVFRYQSPGAYWELIASRTYLTWQVNKVTDGKPTFVANTGSYSPVTNSVTIAVRNRGGLIEVSIDGHLRRTVFDQYLSTATGAGMVVTRGRARDARFSSFSFVGS